MAQAAPETQRVTVGRYLANRLRDAGCSHIFAVAGEQQFARGMNPILPQAKAQSAFAASRRSSALVHACWGAIHPSGSLGAACRHASPKRNRCSRPGDYNLTLLDCMSNVPGLKMVYTCSELGAGYAADGFARFKGVGAAVTTLGVGGMSAVNAAAGCYAEDLVGGRGARACCCLADARCVSMARKLPSTMNAVRCQVAAISFASLSLDCAATYCNRRPLLPLPIAPATARDLCQRRHQLERPGRLNARAAPHHRPAG